MERVAVVLKRKQRLQRRPDVVEADLLGVERAPARLDVVLELLAPVVARVDVANGDGPYAPRDASEDRVLGIEPVAEEERQVGRDVVDLHAAREVVLEVREAVRERERELADRVRPRLRDVVT